jgi:hypothetical protein
MKYPIYEIVKGEHFDTIQRTDADGKVWSIPIDPSNSDYQRYLNPEAEQSTPNLPE